MVQEFLYIVSFVPCAVLLWCGMMQDLWPSTTFSCQALWGMLTTVMIVAFTGILLTSMTTCEKMDMRTEVPSSSTTISVRLSNKAFASNDVSLRTSVARHVGVSEISKNLSLKISSMSIFYFFCSWSEVFIGIW